MSGSDNKDLLDQWLEFYRLGEENVLHQQISNNEEDGAFDDVDSPAIDGVFLKQMAPQNSSWLCSFVQALLRHPDMGFLQGYIK